MSDLLHPNPKPAPSMVRTIVIMLVGLLVVIIGLDLGWHSSGMPSRGGLAFAERALRYGDDRTAAALFGRLAEDRNATAEYWLAQMTEHGLGVPRNPAAAIKLYEKAAQQKFVMAEVRLGEIYLFGNLVLPNPARAKLYLDDAAYHGNARAAMLLGQIYRSGIGEKINPIKADAWFEVAALEGNPLAKRERSASFHNLSMADQVTVTGQAQDILSAIKKNAASAKPDHLVRNNTERQRPKTG